MAQRSRNKSSILTMNSFPTDNASVEAAWREALAIREIGGNDRSASKKRLAQAQVAKTKADTEAITATKNYYAQTRSEADECRQRAELTLSKAERIMSDAVTRAADMEQEIKFKLKDVSQKRSDARDYAKQLEDAARSAADALITQAREGAEELASRMRRDSAEDIRKILSDIEAVRAAAEDELEAQRLLTETARIRAFTVGLNAEDAPVELARQNSTKKKAVARKVSAKKSAPKLKAVKKVSAKKPAPKLKAVKKVAAKKPTPIRARSAKKSVRKAA